MYTHIYIIYIYPFIHSTTIALSRVSSSLQAFSAGACTRILHFTRSFPRRHGGIKSASPFGGARHEKKKKKERKKKWKRKEKGRKRKRKRKVTFDYWLRSLMVFAPCRGYNPWWRHRCLPFPPFVHPIFVPFHRRLSN